MLLTPAYGLARGLVHTWFSKPLWKENSFHLTLYYINSPLSFIDAFYQDTGGEVA